MAADNLEIATKVAQIVVAIVAGYIAWLARTDAKRNSISGLLKLVSDQRKEHLQGYVSHLTEVLSPNSGFAAKPKEYKKIILDQLEDMHNTKNGLDTAHERLVREADKSWGLENALGKQLEGVNPNGEKDFAKMLLSLRKQHL